MDQSCDVAQAGGRLDECVDGLARGNVDRRDAHLVPGVAENLCLVVRVLLTHVGQQDMLAHADAPRDRLTDLTGSDDDDHIAHDRILSCWVRICMCCWRSR